MYNEENKREHQINNDDVFKLIYLANPKVC